MFYREGLSLPASTLASTSQPSKKRNASLMAPAALNVQSLLPAQEVEKRQAKKARRRTGLSAQPLLQRIRRGSSWHRCQRPADLAISACGRGLKTVESILCQQLEELFLDGCDLASGQYLIAAVIFFNLSLKSQAMPRVKQALQGWRRLAPPQARLPIPYEAVALMAQMAFGDGLVSIGLFLLSCSWPLRCIFGPRRV